MEYITGEASSQRKLKGNSAEGPGSGCGLQQVGLSFFFLLPFFPALTLHTIFRPEETAGLLMSTSMCGCGCSIISSLMKRLGRTACCSDLLSCSHSTSEQLQRLATGCPPQPKVTALSAVTTFTPPDQTIIIMIFISHLLRAVQEAHGALAACCG